MNTRTPWLLAFLALFGLSAGCGVKRWEPQILPEGATPLPGGSVPYLKAHLHSGKLAVYSSWRTPGEGDVTLEGSGVLLAADRRAERAGPLSVPLDSIALLEANREETVSRFAFSGLTVWTVLSTITTVACVMDPKSCFGSCPTFYLEESGSETLVAEGFSSSVARVLEDHDVDALPDAGKVRGDYSVLMRNEAPETHAVRSLHLLAVPRGVSEVVYATSSGAFRTGSRALEPTACRVVGSSGEADCTALVQFPDGHEFFSPADSLDLATEEWVELEFPKVEGRRNLGIVIRGRASLLSTFLFYQTIAYAGHDAGHWLASLERGDRRLAERVMGLPEALGSVDVLLERDGMWAEVGAFGEAGPIASDEQVVTLPPLPPGPVKIRLRMAKGAWRIDRVGLAELGGLVEPIRLEPTSVDPVSGGIAGEEALQRLLDPDQYLVTKRGDAYRIQFALPPEAPEVSLFLDSRGYYYEWMRGEWAGEADPAMVALIFTNPRAALRKMAPAFKAREPEMERTFWSSRFRRNTP